MAIEVSSSSGVICSKCGLSYGRRKGYFPVSYAILHKGIGYIPVCKDCIDSMYNTYLADCGDAKKAVRQVCRKLDLFWNESIFEDVEKKNTTHSMMTAYMAKLNSTRFAGKSYDDTLITEGTFWMWRRNELSTPVKEPAVEPEQSEDDGLVIFENNIEITDDIMQFWGPGFTLAMYRELEQRRQYWMSRLGINAELDIGTEAIIRQVCNLEIAINKDRAAGKPIDKSVNALNTLLGSASLKPSQKKDDSDSSFDTTPFGVWIRRWEDERPMPEVDPKLKDVDGIIRYIDIWFRGHLAKMIGKKNAYSKMYENEIAKIRVDRPEYEEEDDEFVFNEVFEEK